jgi:hypothetical protein
MFVMFAILHIGILITLHTEKTLNRIVFYFPARNSGCCHAFDHESLIAMMICSPIQSNPIGRREEW